MADPCHVLCPCVSITVFRSLSLWAGVGPPPRSAPPFRAAPWRKSWRRYRRALEEACLRFVLPVYGSIRRGGSISWQMLCVVVAGERAPWSWRRLIGTPTHAGSSALSPILEIKVHGSEG